MAVVEPHPATREGNGSTDWYGLDVAEVGRRLRVDPEAGLPPDEASNRLRQDGPNALPTEKPMPGWRRLVHQYANYMQMILVGAVVASLIIKQWSTAIVVFLITIVNAYAGMRQQGKADSAMNALKSMTKTTARVRRGASEAVLPADQVVRGDVVVLAAGGEVPADGRIVSASSLQIDESALTGESVPASKDSATIAGSEVGPGDQTNMAFMSMPVTHGSGTMIVTGTGSSTQVGKIAGMLSATKREKTPLMRQLDVLTLWIVGAAGLTMVLMFALGIHRNQSTTVLFTTAVALAIAAIPEAMPTVLQIILSSGAALLAERNAVIKDLSSVETLGSTSAINSDKTGTLTMNQMTAVEVVDPTDRFSITGIGYGLDGTVKHAAGSTDTIDAAVLPYVISSDATIEGGKVIGDPTEGALLVLAHKAGLDIDATRERFPRLATLPFDPTYKLMATFNKATDSAGQDVVRCFVKGAAPAVISHAATALSNGKSIPWDEDLGARARDNVERMGGKGLRVMAAAIRDIDPASFDPEVDLLGYVIELQVTSLVGMVDPPRDESRQAVADAQSAQIRVRMVTGDDVVTGEAIARQLGIPGEAILGADFAKLSEAERLDRIDGIGVVGRVAPEHKVLLVETLRKKGDVVAMTGDGVNDAPAIKAADIGIAMGTGTEVAKNAGRMILTDDNFATIVHAVEEGRKVYDNLLKYVRFVLVALVAFVLTFLGATIFNIAAGQPFSAVQILWINFVVNAPIGAMIGLDQETPGLMLRRPRPRSESIVTPGLMVTVGLVGLFMAASLDALIIYGHSHWGNYQRGSSIALTAFILMLVLTVFESRDQTSSVLRMDTFDNARLNTIAVIEIVLAVLLTQADFLIRIIGTAQLTLKQFGLALLPALVLLGLWELGKALARSRATTDSRVIALAEEG